MQSKLIQDYREQYRTLQERKSSGQSHHGQKFKQNSKQYLFFQKKLKSTPFSFIQSVTASFTKTEEVFKLKKNKSDF